MKFQAPENCFHHCFQNIMFISLSWTSSCDNKYCTASELIRAAVEKYGKDK